MYDTATLPPLILPSQVSVVPIDAAVLVAEVKSQLATETFEQVKRQRDTIGRMFHSRKLSAESRFIVPHAILAFESAISPERVWDWFKESADLLSVCVISGFSVDRTGPAELQQVRMLSADDQTHVLSFIFRLINLLETVVAMRTGSSPAFERYLLPELDVWEKIDES